MSKIFLCYRREDSLAVAGRIKGELCGHFGPDAVFLDVENVPGGVDIQEHIELVLSRCNVFLAVIGPNWAAKRSFISRRIDNPWVRFEIETALKQGLPVIPVLIDHTRMPSKADLPPSLSPLARRNAVRVDQGLDFHHHVGRLIREIELYLRRVPKLVCIERGSFLMGSTKDQMKQLMRLFPQIWEYRHARYDHEQPQHPVKITRPFFLGIHQVTQCQYQAVMGKNPSYFLGSDDLPVEQVSWLDAVRFCNKLSEQKKRTPFYRINGTEVTIAGGNGYRLPTEAEWEYACRAGSTTLYPFGDEVSKLGDHAWYSGNSGQKTHPVGQKRPNAWGLYDMLGNVNEWCQDWYEAGYYGASPPADPPGPARASYRVIRGGHYNCTAVWSADRDRYSPGDRYRDLGFRVAAVEE